MIAKEIMGFGFMLKMELLRKAFDYSYITELRRSQTNLYLFAICTTAC